MDKRKTLNLDETWDYVYEDYDSSYIDEYYMAIINHTYIFTKDDKKLLETDTYYYDLDQISPILLKA